MHSIHTVCIAARARRVCNVWLQYDGGGAAVTATIARIARRRLAPDRKNEEAGDIVSTNIVTSNTRVVLLH